MPYHINPIGIIVLYALVGGIVWVMPTQPETADLRAGRNPNAPDIISIQAKLNTMP
jgi:hypothetical protein